MAGLYLAIRSFADMTQERAITVARVFDAHPGLRPLSVGGDPARTRLEPSMEAIVASQGLPIEWLTLRGSAGDDDAEHGELDLLPGRGGWVGEPRGGGWEFALTGHSLEQRWTAATIEGPATVDEVAELFEELVVAMDAAYGYVTAEALMPRPPHTAILRQLPGVFWLNYFGPAFLTGRPALNTVTGATLLSSGGLQVRTTVSPSQRVDVEGTAWQGEVRELFGAAAFASGVPNPALPSIEEHVQASPGAMEMPWMGWLAQQETKARAKRYAAARKRLGTALKGRPDPQLAADAVEWSTSFDAGGWQDFAGYLAGQLRGDLTRAVGRAAIAVAATAPIDEEDHVLLDTMLGAIRLGWFVDDTDTIDVYIWGPAAVTTVCEAWSAGSSAGDH